MVVQIYRFPVGIVTGIEGAAIDLEFIGEDKIVLVPIEAST